MAQEDKQDRPKPVVKNIGGQPPEKPLFSLFTKIGLVIIFFIGVLPVGAMLVSAWIYDADDRAAARRQQCIERQLRKVPRPSFAEIDRVCPPPK